MGRPSLDSPNEFVTRSVRELYGCEVGFLGGERLNLTVSGQVQAIEVCTYFLIKEIGTHRVFAWLDPFASASSPKVVSITASATVFSSQSAFGSWLNTLQRAA